jgi:microcompartment protein CcmK/EutM
MLVIQPLTPDCRPPASAWCVSTATGAGAGEIIYWVRGREASFPFLPAEAAGRFHRRGHRRFRACETPAEGRGFAHAGSQEGAENNADRARNRRTGGHSEAPSHEGRKVLLVQPLNLDGSDRGDAVVALDAVDAGVGDRVLLVTEGFSAMTAVGRPQSPIDMAVIGFIDHVDLLPGVE